MWRSRSKGRALVYVQPEYRQTYCTGALEPDWDFDDVCLGFYRVSRCLWLCGGKRIWVWKKAYLALDCCCRLVPPATPAYSTWICWDEYRGVVSSCDPGDEAAVESL